MERQHRTVVVLAGCQAALQTVTTTVMAVTGLAGFALASDKSLATLPITCFVLGSAIMTVPASLLMGATGRRAGFQLGGGVGAIGAALCAYAMYLASFWLLCAGMIVLGMHAAFGSYYRFAAADSVKMDFRAKAIALTLAGGIVGGFLGPDLASGTATLFSGHAYLGTYLVLAVVCLGAVLGLSCLKIPRVAPQDRGQSTRPLRRIVKQPVFIVAALAMMLSYGVMNLMMTSTPLAMHAHEHQFHDTAFVLQWHMIAMFAPSFFTGAFIQRFGVLNVIMSGAALLLACISVAIGGMGLGNFWVSLALLGAGWNFMYIGGSALLGECHTPLERAKAEAAASFMVFATMTVSSASSGLLLHRSGWEAISYGSIPFVLLAMAATAWLMWQRRAEQQATPLVQSNRA